MTNKSNNKFPSLTTNSQTIKNLHIPSVLQFSFSIIASIMLFLFSSLLAISSIIPAINQPEINRDTLPPLLISAGLSFSGLLLIPSIIFSFLRLANIKQPRFALFTKISRYFHFFLFAYPFVLFLGTLVTRHTLIAWFTLPLLHILAIGLPICWLLALGGKGLSLGSNQRAWGILGVGLILSPMLIFTMEMIAFIGYMLIIATGIAAKPDLAEKTLVLLNQLITTRSSPDAIVQLIAPYMLEPWVIFLVLSFGAAIVPIIEESLKPLGVWLVLGKNLSPIQGFTAGLISGAGYAFFESLVLSSTTEAWAPTVMARAGTAVIHMTTTGLAGWALACAWRDRRYIQLGVIYALNVIVHGLWNGLTLTAVLVSIGNLSQSTSLNAQFYSIQVIAPLGLVVLMIAILILLYLSNKKLKAGLHLVANYY